MDPALRSRMLERFLKCSGVREPEQSHISQAEALVFSEKPSAKARFPGGITISRCYGRLEAISQEEHLAPQVLEDVLELPELGLRVTVSEAEEIIQTPDTFTVKPGGPWILRSRETGDHIRLKGGSKSLKKLFIDRKIPASHRDRVPVIADETGILGVYGIGTDLDHGAQQLPAVTIRFVKTDKGD